MKLECRAFPTLSTMAEVVMDDSMHKIAIIASNLLTSFLNISLACAARILSNSQGTIHIENQHKHNIP